MSCGYSENIGASKFKCVKGVLKEFPTLSHMFSRHSPPITGKPIGKCPVCNGGAPVKVGFYCLEVTSKEYLKAFNGSPY